MAEIQVPAALERLDEVQMFFLDQIEVHTCPERTRAILDVGVEEIFVNIARYAYPPGQTGQVRVGCQVDPDPLRVTLVFADRGVPFDPLAKRDADITLSADDRPIGGLGILMVKRFMTRMTYAYEEGQNVLTLVKEL